MEEEEKKEELDSVAEPENNRDQDHSNDEVKVLADEDETIREENN